MENEDDSDDLTLARLSLVLESYNLAKHHVHRLLLSSNLLPPSDLLVADQILAISHALSSSSSTDHYSALLLGSSQLNIFSPDSLIFNYRRLSSLLDPAANPLPNASRAFDRVREAYSILSDPEKKSRYDAEMKNRERDASPNFWTVCKSCFRVHQYERSYKGKSLKCGTCGTVFRAAELKVEPPIVEGTDMYYCDWGFFPKGFRGGNGFEEVEEEEEEEEEEVGPSGQEEPERKKARRAPQTARKTVGPPPHLRKKVVQLDDEEEDDGVLDDE